MITDEYHPQDLNPAEDCMIASALVLKDMSKLYGDSPRNGELRLTGNLCFSSQTECV